MTARRNWACIDRNRLTWIALESLDRVVLSGRVDLDIFWRSMQRLERFFSQLTNGKFKGISVYSPALEYELACTYILDHFLGRPKLSSFQSC